MSEPARAPGRLGPVRGAGLYLAALMGPGVLLVPALAQRAAGPASIIAWGVLLVLSLPLAATFAVLGVRHPVDAGVSAYAEEAFGPRAGTIVGGWFVAAVLLGAPAVAVIGGGYVASLAGGGHTLVIATAAAILATAYLSNAIGISASTGLAAALSGVLTAVLAVVIVVVLPTHAGHDWTPFAPHGRWAVGTAMSILIWLFVGWEAAAQLAGEFRVPARDLPRAITGAYLVIAILYAGLAVATITAPAPASSPVPLADLMRIGFGHTGETVTAVIAVALTLGTINAYMAAATKLWGHLTERGTLPGWAGRHRGRASPRRALATIAVSHVLVLGLLAVGTLNATALVRATGACFIAVYVLALAAAARVLEARARWLALSALLPMLVVAVFCSLFAIVPLVVAAGFAVMHRRSQLRAHLQAAA